MASHKCYFVNDLTVSIFARYEIFAYVSCGRKKIAIYRCARRKGNPILESKILLVDNACHTSYFLLIKSGLSEGQLSKRC